MNGANKILTVSYGTFSCTLEGFDDPFNMMKAIAEYFRDLAAEDRYFGAEPATPDAAMLQRIAEREIQRRVEAKIQENGVILNARAAPPAAEMPPVTTEAPVEPAIADNMVAHRPAPVQDAALPLQQEHSLPPEDPMAETVAAKLTRIRSVVAQGRPAAPIAEERPATYLADYAEDEDAPRTALQADLSPAFTPEPEADFGAEIDLVALTAEVADNLEEASDESEDLATADLPPTDEAATAIDAEGDDTVAGILARLSAESTPEAEPADDLEEVLADGFDDELPEVGSPDLAASDEVEEAGAALAPDMHADDLIDDIEDEDSPAEELSTRIERARARVVRIRHAEPTVKDATPEEEAAGDLDNIFAAEPVRETSSDDGEEKVEPAAKADADRTVRPSRPARPTLGIEGQSPAASGTGTHPQFSTPADESEAAVSRLLAETNSQMAGLENRRRLSAIQHLKAAVAATVAERRAGAAKPVNDEDRIDPYRTVLSRIVRPNQPAGDQVEAGGAPAEASPETAPRPALAPLVLVSEQRIDKPQADNVLTLHAAPPANSGRAPVLLTDLVTREEDEITLDPADFREVEDDSALFSDNQGFAEFAERLGAENLPALLEAAAAYAACIEGRTHFSRPQIMRQVDAMTGEASTREDTLRSFGALLRTGRIVKVKRGQYALSEENDLLAEARKLVG